MNPLEIIAVALGIANVGLLVRRSIWNYPFGMAMVALYFVIFREARLYGEAGLQVFFFVVQGWGWWLWARAGGLARMVSVSWMGWPARIGGLVLVAGSSLGIGWAMARYTDAALPYADAAIAGASVVAQVLLAMRRTENWALWIAIDVLSIWVYINRALYLTAGLYVVFLGLAIAGLMAWAKAAREGEAIAA
ncbi:MAG: nicotinamide riboside transporter PnuC [Erythrobacter sp.]|jgi:nicotinamide mononucleotide transporter|uniref:nicotinamide riboside transporter PnuC n=1 Tax=Erythrobacter sp. TaxID=1042 RepID=UPI002B47B27D|nr:nicotinamide riboside transporter PnuC [Erythrobacter sp.]WRH69244.1 MAG: nicotinamide riboside transporter PnuC [Erythrobacter sp.]